MAQYSQQQIQDMITATAQKYGLPPNVALAVVQHESSFNPAAVSQPNSNGTRDYGLFQLNTALLSDKGITPDQALDPAVNIDAGVSTLATYWQKYGGDLPSVLGAYNAGPGAVSSGNLPSAYISSVMNILGPDFGSTSDTGSSDTGSSDTSPVASGMVNILGTDVPISALALGGAGFALAMWLAFKD